ncbi:hypothetical protein Ancab_031005 [Ancistrocladus abbreviatus]
MHTNNILLSTTLFPGPLNPNHILPQSNARSKWRGNLKLRCQLASARIREPISNSGPSIVPINSSCDHNCLSSVNWPQLLQISIESQNLKLGQSTHAYFVKLGYKDDTFMCNNLINLYSKFNLMDDAQNVFDEMLVRNTVSWTSLINGYCNINDSESVFRVTHEMNKKGEAFNAHSCSVIMRACESPEGLILGQQIHGFAVKLGIYEDVVVGTSTISMYANCGYLDDAEHVFHDQPYVDIQCLNLMIMLYGKLGDGLRAIDIFLGLINCGFEPNDYTYTNMISSCGDILSIEEGKQLHGLATKSGLLGTSSVGNAVITMYAKHGLMQESEKMFLGMRVRNLISWTALLSGYVKNGHFTKAFGVFLDIMELGIPIDPSCWTTVIDGCSESKKYKLGLQLHASLIKLGYLFDVHTTTALVDFYAKNGNTKSAKLAFHGGSEKMIPSFNAVLAGLTETVIDGEEDPIVFFNQQRSAGMVPDMISFCTLLSLSASYPCLITGRCVHAYIVKTGYESDLSIGNALISMYGKCGVIEDACRIFNSMNSYDIVSWNSMISAFSVSGQGEDTLLLFEQMKRQGYTPDGITILGVLQACSYSGLVEDGVCLFHEMESKYGIRPVIEHFVCMVDLLGRAELLSEAVYFISRSPFCDSVMLWRSLVHICKLHGDTRVGKIASEHLLSLAPKDAGSYMLVSNMYAGAGMFSEAAKVRTMMNDLKVRKEAGCSWTEINNKVHRFMASRGDLTAILDPLGGEMRWSKDDSIYLEVV